MSHNGPTFLGVGVMKCGTTTLHHYCRRHPDIFVPFLKESNFLVSNEFDSGNLWEYEHMLNPSKPFLAHGEFCPGYIDAYDRIHEFYPNTKIVISVRDPIERMISHMRHVASQPPSHPFLAAKPWDELITEIIRGEDPAMVHDTIRLSMYENRLTPFLERFENVLVMRCEDLTDKCEESYLRFCEFLNVHPMLPNGVLKMHTAEITGRGELPLNDYQRGFFREIFKPTYDWLDKTFS